MPLDEGTTALLDAVTDLVAKVERDLKAALQAEIDARHSVQAELSDEILRVVEQAQRNVSDLRLFVSQVADELRGRLSPVEAGVDLVRAVAADLDTVREEVRESLAEREAATLSSFANIGERLDAANADAQTMIGQAVLGVEKAAEAIVRLAQRVDERTREHEELSAKADRRHDELRTMADELRVEQAALRAMLGGLESRQTQEVVAAGLSMIREDRLDLDEGIFAARRRFEAMTAMLEERLASIKDGEPGPAGEPGPEGQPGRDGADGATGELRGLYDEHAEYRRLDRVSLNGSEWIARRDDPGPLPGDGWMLGAQGKRGKPGISIESAAVDGYAMVFELSNGKTLRADLRAMFERYDEERG